MSSSNKDTIAQIATASGPGGVGIIRVSGPQALTLGRALTGAHPEERRAELVSAKEASGEVIDRGLYLEFVGPRSFTGEDVCEFHGHGGAIGLGRVLRRLVDLGARPAGPGEFSLRAFLNKKIDLAQAEAIALAVSASTEEAHRLAQRQAGGELSQRVAAIRAPLLDAASALNADVDFPDEDLGSLDHGHVNEALAAARAAVGNLLNGYQAGRWLRDGAVVVIAGPPNAGKSSLLNALLGFERAIVSPLAGTTRDTVEERVLIGRVPVRLVDTAGMRESGDVIETAGIARAKMAVDKADLVVGLVSADSEWSEFVARAPERVLWVRNKVDLGADPALDSWVETHGALAVSLRTGSGVTALRAELEARLAAETGGGEPLVTAERHAQLLREAFDALGRAGESLSSGASAELVLVDVNISIHRLGAVVGENLTEAVLEQIFARFCIGK